MFVIIQILQIIEFMKLTGLIACSVLLVTSVQGQTNPFK